ncbi:cell division protein ZapB [Tropicibacter sp. S64]|uniref:cell division protein ZapB n=1 Tax=Tropicibacter sp. S64 TaxID=3415122 RepID=UPI003C7D9394
MIRFVILRMLAALGLVMPCVPLSAQTVLSGNYSVDGRLCAGPECWNNEDFTDTTVKIKHSEVRLVFEDTSTGGFPSVDWKLEANGITGAGNNYFAILNKDAAKPILTLHADAPSNALYLAGNGRLGLGTSIPQASLHIVDGSDPGIAFETTGASQTWQLHGNGGGFFVRDAGSGALPFEIRTGAPDLGFYMNAAGRIGLGTDAPSASLHIRRADGTASLRVENTAPAPGAVREMFNMTNNGGSYFTLANSSTGRAWYYVHENNAQGRFMINHSDGGIQLALTRQGDLTVMGKFISGNTQLNVPDYVFAEDYALRPLAEVQAFIDAHSHLPDVPSAAQIAREGLDMTEMQLTLLRKVEELTLYTLQQEAVIAEQRAALADQQAETETRMQALLARIEQLEGKR